MLSKARAEARRGDHHAGAAGDGEARCCGDEEGRQLRREALAYGKGAVAREGAREREVVAERAEGDAGDEVDADDEHPRERLALHEAQGPVHRAVEAGLGGEGVAATVRLCAVDGPRTKLDYRPHTQIDAGLARFAAWLRATPPV